MTASVHPISRRKSTRAEARLLTAARTYSVSGLVFRAWSTLEATQGQMDDCFSQLPYTYHQNRVPSVGD